MACKVSIDIMCCIRVVKVCIYSNSTFLQHMYVMDIMEVTQYMSIIN